MAAQQQIRGLTAVCKPHSLSELPFSRRVVCDVLAEFVLVLGNRLTQPCSMRRWHVGIDWNVYEPRHEIHSGMTGIRLDSDLMSLLIVKRR